MLMIEGVEYGPCGYCHNWYPIEEGIDLRTDRSKPRQSGVDVLDAGVRRQRDREIALGLEPDADEAVGRRVGHRKPRGCGTGAM